ncbi:hypothetical protein, partial [Saccharibacillus alkalitolerans]|uniref:hypothetical protein n=1 Tax=Saccharibacillus alkalitolerans TaxID=2705290 RepID=UPI00198118D9
MPGSSMVIAMTDGSEVTVTTGTQTLLDRYVPSETRGDHASVHRHKQNEGTVDRRIQQIRIPPSSSSNTERPVTCT